ncbi:MAG: hypothetical protein AAGI46_00375 [Planctomycetota bacterium]
MQRLACTIFCVTAVVLVGCSTQSHTDRTSGLVSLFVEGRYNAAASEAGGLAEESDRRTNSDRLPRDGLVIRLEQGAALRAAGLIDESTRVFRRADRLFQIADETPKVQLGSETTALWTNPTALAYRGTQYDRVLVATMQAMNQIELGDLELARVFIRDAGRRLRDAKDKFEADIERDRREADRAVRSRGGDVDEAWASSLRRTSGRPVDAIDYGVFANPLPDVLAGMLFLAGETTRGDLERAVVAFRRAQALEPGNTYLAELYDLAEASANAGTFVGEPRVHVIYAAGMAPTRLEWRIDVPLYIFPGDIGRAGAPGIALPQLAYGPPGAVLTASASGEPFPTQRVASIERVVTAEFDAAYDGVVSRAVASAIIRTLAAIAVNTATDRAADEVGGPEGLLIFLLGRIGTSVAQVATNAADLRTWRLIPARYEIASFPAPADGSVQLNLGGRSVTVELPSSDGRVTHFIFVRQPTPGSPPSVRAATVGVR